MKRLITGLLITFTCALSICAQWTLVARQSSRFLWPTHKGAINYVTFDLPVAGAEQAEGIVVDLHGHEVNNLKVLSPTSLMWDGRDRRGKVVQSGIYFVQIKLGDAEPWQGQLNLAR